MRVLIDEEFKKDPAKGISIALYRWGDGWYTQGGPFYPEREPNKLTIGPADLYHIRRAQAAAGYYIKEDQDRIAGMSIHVDRNCEANYLFLSYDTGTS